MADTEVTPNPKHGNSSTETENSEQRTHSVSQADGTADSDPRGETGATQAQPSAPMGDNPATAGQGSIEVKSKTPENRKGQINPSAPTEGTEGSSTKMNQQFSSRGPSTMDAAGETGNPSGKGTLEVDEQNLSAEKQSAQDSATRQQESKQIKNDEDIEPAA